MESPAGIPSAPRRKVVIGHFDPLTAMHALRLAELRTNGEQLVVAITDPPRPLLPALARAELVAALAAVDYVFVSVDNAWNHGDSVINEEARDLERRDALAARVMARQNAK